MKKEAHAYGEYGSIRCLGIIAVDPEIKILGWENSVLLKKIESLTKNESVGWKLSDWVSVEHKKIMRSNGCTNKDILYFVNKKNLILFSPEIFKEYPNLKDLLSSSIKEIADYAVDILRNSTIKKTINLMAYFEATLEKVATRKDKTFAVTLGTQELSAQDIASIMEYNGELVNVMFLPNNPELMSKILSILKEYEN